jgi:methionine-rich copper-binding protein CopC
MTTRLNRSFAILALTSSLIACGALAQTAKDPHAGHDMSKMQMPSSSMGAKPGMAHVMVMPLDASTPADGASVKGSPANLSLTLSHAMVFRSVQLRTAAGQRVPLNATLPTTMVKTVTIPVRTLSAGQYIVEWRAESGHEMVGSFSFTVQ